MTSSEITIGRWLVRAVPPGAEHWNDRRNERDEALVEILDTSSVHPEYSPRGQFVSSYYASTILAHTPGVGLDMHGGVPAWTMSAAEVDQMLAFLRELLRPQRGADMRQALSRRRSA